jgi:hypothetical protein
MESGSFDYYCIGADHHCSLLPSQKTALSL